MASYGLPQDSPSLLRCRSGTATRAGVQYCSSTPRVRRRPEAVWNRGTALLCKGTGKEHHRHNTAQDFSKIPACTQMETVATSRICGSVARHDAGGCRTNLVPELARKVANNPMPPNCGVSAAQFTSGKWLSIRRLQQRAYRFSRGDPPQRDNEQSAEVRYLKTYVSPPAARTRVAQQIYMNSNKEVGYHPYWVTGVILALRHPSGKGDLYKRQVATETYWKIIRATRADQRSAAQAQAINLQISQSGHA